jgi:uncharacterized protein (PEP-CTERM system associated)
MKLRPGARRAMPSWQLYAFALPLGLASASVLAQQTRVTTGVQLTETLTDNVDLASGDKAKSDQITVVSPSITVSRSGGKLEGNLRTAVNSALYAEDHTRNSNFFSVNGTGRLTAIENRAYIDLLGSISREAVSSFGARSGDSVTGTANLTDVKNLSISPYLRGRFHSTGTADLRYNYTITDTASGVVSKSRQGIWTVNLIDEQALGYTGWSFNYIDNTLKQSGSWDLKTTSARFSGISQITPQLKARLIGGSEENNYTLNVTQRSTIYGGGADWTLSPRTKFSGTWEHRFYGPGYNFSADHKAGVFVFNGTYSKDATRSNQTLGSGNTSGYALAYSMVDPQITNPIDRQAAANQLLLQNPGLNASQAVLSNGVFLDRRMQFSASYVGIPRTTYVFSFYRSERNSLVEQTSAVVGDFATSSRVVDLSGTVAVTHRLTPVTSASIDYTSLFSHGDPTSGNAAVTSRTNRVNTGLMTSLTPRVRGSVFYRYGKATGTSSYTENAVIGSLGVNF